MVLLGLWRCFFLQHLVKLGEFLLVDEPNLRIIFKETCLLAPFIFLNKVILQDVFEDHVVFVSYSIWLHPVAQPLQLLVYLGTYLENA